MQICKNTTNLMWPLTFANISIDGKIYEDDMKWLNDCKLLTIILIPNKQVTVSKVEMA